MKFLTCVDTPVVTSFNTRSDDVILTSSDVVTALGFTPGSGTLTSVGISSTAGTLTISGSPITTSGTIDVALSTTGVSSGSYTNANISVDLYGRITTASNGSSVVPGGSSGALQFNNSGSFDGTSQISTDGVATLNFIPIGLTPINIGSVYLPWYQSNATGIYGVDAINPGPFFLPVNVKGQNATDSGGIAGDVAIESGTATADLLGKGGDLWLAAGGCLDNNTIYGGHIKIDGASAIAPGDVHVFAGSNASEHGSIQIGKGSSIQFQNITGTVISQILTAGDFQWNGSSGTAGQVLTSSGAGVHPTWSQIVPIGFSGQLQFNNSGSFGGAEIEYSTSGADVFLSANNPTGNFVIRGIPGSGIPVALQGGSGFVAGQVSVSAGAATASDGAPALIFGGDTAGLGAHAGPVTITAGNAVASSGFGGNINLLVGTGPNGNGNIQTNGNINIDQIPGTPLGSVISIREGGLTAAISGLVTLVAGTVVVSNTLITANTRIHLTIQNPNGTVGLVYVSARTPGTNFTISSTSGSDLSDVAFLMIEPY